MPLAIQYTAALYKLFWDEFHVSISAPEYVTVLNPVAVSASGKIDGAEPYSWEWDFAFDGTFNPEPGASEQTVTIPVDRYKYDSRITKTIALRPNGDDSKIQTKHIYIRPYSLGISAPNGEDSRYRYFKPPDSDLVEHFQWNFGGGSPTVIGRTQEHTYAESGDYHVTLTLQLYGGSAIKSDEYIWVGSGTRYIPGHTTYGDETWYTGGTYVVQGSITVAQGATLTIESGVEVQLNGGVQMDVYGTLTATGETFTWADGVNAWNGMAFYDAGASGSRLENCVIEHAKGYMSSWDANIWSPILRVSKSSPTIKGCAMQNCAPEGAFPSWIPYVLMEGGSPILQRNTLNGLLPYTGISIGSGASPTLTQNTVVGLQTGSVSPVVLPLF